MNAQEIIIDLIRNKVAVMNICKGRASAEKIHPDVKDTTTRKLLVGALAALPYRGQYIRKD